MFERLFEGMLNTYQSTPRSLAFKSIMLMVTSAHFSPPSFSTSSCRRAFSQEDTGYVIGITEALTIYRSPRLTASAPRSADVARDPAVDYVNSHGSGVFKLIGLVQCMMLVASAAQGTRGTPRQFSRVCARRPMSCRGLGDLFPADLKHQSRRKHNRKSRYGPGYAEMCAKTFQQFPAR